MKAIEFFFDFSSPYAYLAHCRLPALADEYGYEVVYQPVDLFAARQAAGNTGPSSPQIPNKFRYIRQDILRWADRYGAPFVFPKTDPNQPGGIRKDQIDSTRAHKAMFFAAERGQAREFASGLWARTYGCGGFVGDDENLRSVARELGWSVDALFEFINSGEADKRYEDLGREAHERGVFGVPIMLIGEEMWWGNDRLDFLEEYLAAHSAR